MELLFFSLSLILPIVSFTFIFHFFTSISKSHLKTNLPPGSFGWPLIGETYHFLSQDAQIFIKDRMTKFSSKIFKTSLFGDPVVVLCGPSGHKFISANEGKLMTVWRPVSMQKLFRGSYQQVSSNTSISDQSKANLIRSSELFKPEALVAFAEVMDSMAKEHFEGHWIGKSEVEVCGLLQLHIVGVAAKLFMGLEDPQRLAKIGRLFNIIGQGLHAFPYNIPGTSFARAKKASDAMRDEILMVIKQKNAALAQGEKPHDDYLSHMMSRGDRSGKFMPENEVADKVMGLAFASFSSPSLALTYLMKYLGEEPEVYEKIRAEQMEILESKRPGEPLSWDDLSKMKYSWNVLLEVMRLVPPLQGTFREATTDFTYENYTIPKGWKIYWTVSSTNKDPEFFPEPDKFDPTRFESDLVPFLNIPFGGGRRVCPGKDYARLLMLIYLHHAVRLFKWELVNFNPKVAGSMNPIPIEGVWIRLQPCSNCTLFKS